MKNERSNSWSRRDLLRLGRNVVALAPFIAVGACLTKQEYDVQGQDIKPAALIFPNPEKGKEAFNVPADGKMYSIDGGMIFIIDKRVVLYDTKAQEATFLFQLNKRRPIELELPLDKPMAYLMAVDPKLAGIPSSELFSRYGQSNNDPYLLEGEIGAHKANEMIVKFKNVQQGKVYVPFYRPEFFQQSSRSSSELIQETIFLTFGNPVIPDIFSTPNPHRV